MIVEKGDFHFAEKYFFCGGGGKVPLPPTPTPSVPTALNNMKSQIKKKSNSGIVELLIPKYSKKKASLEGTKTFLGKKL